MSEFGVFPGPYFSVLGLNTEIYSAILPLFSKFISVDSLDVLLKAANL